MLSLPQVLPDEGFEVVTKGDTFIRFTCAAGEAVCEAMVRMCDGEAVVTAAEKKAAAAEQAADAVAAAAQVGFGCIFVSETEVPNLCANVV